MIKIPRNLSSDGKSRQAVKKSRTTPQSNAYDDETGELNSKDFLNSSKFNATCLAHVESKKFNGKFKKFSSGKSGALNHNASKPHAVKSAQKDGANRNLTAKAFYDTSSAQEIFSALSVRTRNQLYYKILPRQNEISRRAKNAKKRICGAIMSLLMMKF